MRSLTRHVRCVPPPRIGEDSGVILVVTLLVMMLMAALMAGFFAAVNSDMRSNALDKDSTRAYAAAHAGLEKLTSDLAQLFNADVAPTVAKINALLQYPPVIPGFGFTAPGGTTGSGYAVTWKADANGNPTPDDLGGSNIIAGPYRGLKGIITNYTITITARSTSGGSEMRLRRQLQTVGVPVFQFGVYSQGDLSFFAGPNFNFGGRVQTNGTLYLAEGNANTLTMSDYVTAAGEIIRWELSNGYLTSGSYTGNVSVIRAQGGPWRNLARTEGSLVNGRGSGTNEPTWTTLSIGTYKSYIRSSRTGGKQLQLPLVSQGATPIDLIRRAPANEDVNNPNVYAQRFYTQASLRMLLSDRAADMTALPGVTGTAPVSLDNWIAGVPAGYGPVDATHPPIARSPGPMAATTTLNGAPVNAAPNMVFNVNGAVPTLLKMPAAGLTVNGVGGINCTGKTATSFTGCVLGAVTLPTNKPVTAVLTYGTYTWTAATTTTGSTGPGPGTFTIPVVSTAEFSRSFFWVDTTGAAAGTTPNAALVSCTGYTDTGATHQFTGCSYKGPALPANGDTITTNALVPQDTALNGGFIKIEKQDNNGAWTDVTVEILNLGFAGTNSEGAICADPNLTAVIRIQRLRDNGGLCDYASSQNPYDYWPNALYDPREGYLRDAAAGSAVTVGGVMNYIALDLNNLKKWFAGTTGTTGAVANNNNNSGYIVYFSDRRGNHNPGAAVANAETAEYGSEDIVNPTIANGAANGVLDNGEDVNANGVLDVYGQSPAACCGVVPAGAAAPLDATALPWTQFVAPNGNPGQARVNRQVLFRRALELVNAGIVGGVSSLPQGFTVAAENPVYLLGNYNATATSASAAGSVPAAVIADSVTLLSNQWTDGASFESPDNPAGRAVTSPASYRMAIASGKTLSFTKPVFAGAANDFGTDGGVHNFLRYIEGWNGQTLNYNGSLVSLFTSRQAIGTYKCCTTVYSPPTRAYNFDATFLNPALLPPGTPMFRDINTLTFRQILRPTQ